MRDIGPHTLVETGLSNTRDFSGARHWVCRIIAGVDAGKQTGIGTRPVVIGASAACDFVIHDPKVSRRHAELRATPEGMSVEDLGSTNGTFYQSSRVTAVVVAPDSSIRVGDTTLQLAAAAPQRIQPSQRRRFGGLVGASLAMREVFAILEMAGPSDATVLIAGESGTGKELTARALHDHSKRAECPFVVIDCSAVSEGLIESHLFGHRRGAFTGATADRKGAFVEASGGTLFLDEIGELPTDAQRKLLRAVEAQTVLPVGSDEPVRVDTRVIAATHRSLEEMVEDKQFRSDLYYRLAVVQIQLPPLRERLEDLPDLVRYFYEGRGVQPRAIGGANLQRLRSYDWPGNVRELRNVLERAWVFSDPGCPFEELNIDLHPSLRPHPGEVVDSTLSFKDAKERWLSIFERRYVGTLYVTHSRNISSAAKQAGINRNHFRKLLIKHGLIQA